MTCWIHFGRLLKNLRLGLRIFLATESPLNMMKNPLYFTLKPLFLKIFKFLSWLFGHVEKLLDWKDKVNFKIYYVITWLTNNCNTHTIASSCLIFSMIFGKNTFVIFYYQTKFYYLLAFTSWNYICNVIVFNQVMTS